MGAPNPATSIASPKSLCATTQPISFGLTAIFLLLGLVGITRHEPWADEVHAWLVAVQSENFSALVQNCRTYGHPLLWNGLVYAVTRLTSNILWMQVVHLIVAAASVYVFVRFAPFSVLNKCLFTFGYFIFFEYSLISRAYVIGMLCVWLFCMLFYMRQRTRLPLALILALMANTSVFGAIMAITFALTLLLDEAVARRTGPHRLRSADGYAAAMIIIVGTSLSILQMVPPPGEGFPAIWRTDVSWLKLAKVLTTIWNSYVPLPDFFITGFWESNAFDRAYPEHLYLIGTLHVLLSLGLLMTGLLAFARRPIVLFCYACGTSGILLFEYTKYFGFLRHHGHLFILLIACLWLTRWYGPIAFPIKIIDTAGRRIEAICGGLLTLLLSLHCAAGVYAYSMELRHPFSGVRAIVRSLEQQGWDVKVNACFPDWLCVSFAHYLKKPLYYPNADRTGTFLIYDRYRQHTLNCEQMVQRVRAFQDSTNQDPMLLTIQRLDCPEAERYFSLVQEFRSDTIYPGDSRWFLYRTSPERTRSP